MRLHKEGIVPLLIFLIILSGILVPVFLFISGLLWLKYLVLVSGIVFYGFVIQFFRHPDRKLKKDEQLVIAPADGKVVVIEETVENEYFNQQRRQISIFMSPLNVHVNRNPVKGELKYVKYHKGKYLVAWHPKSSELNERNTLVYKNQFGELLIRQIAGAMARRIKCYVKAGDELEQSEEFGFITFGSRVDIFLPLSAEVLVNIDDKTRGGQTVIAKLS